jgi:hypothetical protein
MAEPDGRSRPISELTDYSVSILEDFADLHWVVVIQLGVAYCFFLDHLRRINDDTHGRMRHSDGIVTCRLGLRQWPVRYNSDGQNLTAQCESRCRPHCDP